MTLKSVYFDELSTTQLYELLKARAQIFVVEQNCVYQDLDDRDYDSLHIYYESEGRVSAYLRSYIIEGDLPECITGARIGHTNNSLPGKPIAVRVGRVLTMEHGNGLGAKLLKEGIEQIIKKQNPDYIYIEAQCYATGFYEKFGF